MGVKTWPPSVGRIRSTAIRGRGLVDVRDFDLERRRHVFYGGALHCHGRRRHLDRLRHIAFYDLPYCEFADLRCPGCRAPENTGTLTVAETLTVNSGLVSLNEANSIGSVAVTGGVLEVGNSGALVGGTVSLGGGELVGTANETLANSVSFSGTSTIAAAHGMTLKETGTVNTGFNSTLNFGALGQDGVVIWAADNETLGRRGRHAENGQRLDRRHHRSRHPTRPRSRPQSTPAQPSISTA